MFKITFHKFYKFFICLEDDKNVRKMTQISVIIPTWNRAETLGKAISSAYQTFPPFEIVVCGVMIHRTNKFLT
ncbi:hypothetical protein A9239_14190 [Methanosarcina sp. A14]|uniref:Uncharacterized protein n=1 Tax=Methanosarcina barkeri CM1 TaxID=796385 RepID=A0A0G3CCY1_METBA|nr:hypothetical protein MCM1_2855 [Methanosarcina barkeri CM1]OED02685.1 hypothetical protein A9239_14190 [Methanosarcina sp. A14]